MSNFFELPGCSTQMELAELNVGLDGFYGGSNLFDVSFDCGTPSLALSGTDIAPVAHKPTRKYKPRIGELREKNSIAQRNYRKRRKEREAEMLAALESARSELKSLRVEHAYLTQENCALETLGQYSESLFEYLRRVTGAVRDMSIYAVGCTSGVVPSSLVSLVNSLRERAWAELVVPTEVEYKFLTPMITRGLVRCTFMPFYRRISSAIVEWTTMPHQRREIERRINALLDSRVGYLVNMEKKSLSSCW